jgi:O-antigen/teichoic acid export membrane protein
MYFFDLDRLKSSVVFRRFIKVFTVDALVQGSAVFLIPIYLKLMSQEEFAHYSYLLNAAGTIAMVFSFGLYVPQTKLFHDCRGPEERGALLFTIAAMLVGLLLVTFGLTYALGLDRWAIALLLSAPIDYASYRLWLLAAMLVAISATMLFNYFVTAEKIPSIQKYNLAKVVGTHGVVLTLLVLLHRDPILIRLKYATLVEGGLIVLFGLAYVRSMRPAFHFPFALRAMKMAIPVQLSALLGVVINFGDKFFLEKYGSAAELSVYYLALSVSSILPMVLMSLQNIWLPLFLKEKDLAANVRKTRQLAGYVTLAFLGIAIAIMIAMKLALVLHAISPKYQAVLPVLPIVLTTQLVTALTPICTNYLVYFEKTYLVIVVGVVVGVIGVGANLCLTPVLTIYGAALSALLCNVTYLGAYYILVTRLIKQRFVIGESEVANEP